VVESESLIVGRNDGSVSSTDETEMEDLRADEVALLPSGEDVGKGDGRD
jgi:hypothetical protein